MAFTPDDTRWMERALQLAALGQGTVEPNPMVGCVIVHAGQVVGEGWHERFGGPHAEANALRAAGDRARGATVYVTLEPCCHFGKTPPCADAVIAAGVTRVVAAMADPFPKVAGGGFAQLKAAGISVEQGLCEADARELNAPYLKLLATGMPWVIAKWAMTLDGKLATREGDSKWISSAASRTIVHQLRSRMDAVIVGRRTADVDDPLLTTRLSTGEAARVATRIVLDSQARLSLNSKLVRTAREAPVLIAVGPEANAQQVAALTAAGCEVVSYLDGDPGKRLEQLLQELGRRRLTNVLVEGGAEVLGSLLDGGLIDEVHAFIAPKLVGGGEAASPIAGKGASLMTEALKLRSPKTKIVDGDVYLSGRLGPG